MSYIKNLCINHLFRVLPPSCFDLIGDFSMSPFGLVFLGNEIVLNRRLNVLEFGSGLSTIYMALIVRNYGLPTRITSVESDQLWVDRLNKKIDELRLNNFVNIIHAPLTQDHEMGGNNQWYDRYRINSSLDISELFDMILIDGPPAFRPDISKSRYGAFPFLQNLLAKEHVVFLDDANRLGEKEVIKLWTKEFGCEFKTYNDRIAVSRRGPFFNSHASFLNTKTSG